LFFVVGIFGLAMMIFSFMQQIYTNTYNVVTLIIGSDLYVSKTNAPEY